MELITSVLEYLQNIEANYLIFDILNKYDKDNNTIDCYKMINELTKKIINNINEYSKDKKEEIYNLIDNDFITLKDLIEEYKEMEYNHFLVKAVSYLTQRNKDELKKIKEYISNLDIVSSEELLNNEIQNNLSFDEFNHYQEMLQYNNHMESYDVIISYIKRKELNTDNYLKLISLYLNYLLGTYYV